MTQVLVRKKMLNGDNAMHKADVLKKNPDGSLRVLVTGERTPRDVQASETVSAVSVFGPRQGEKQSVLPKCYPSSVNALGNILNR